MVSRKVRTPDTQICPTQPWNFVGVRTLSFAPPRPAATSTVFGVDDIVNESRLNKCILPKKHVV